MAARKVVEYVQKAFKGSSVKVSQVYLFISVENIPGRGVHNILRVRVFAAHTGGFLGRNSLNMGPFFGGFSINMGGLSRNWRK